MNPYQQIDIAWLAVDEAGGVAAMITAGEGPIPQELLQVARGEVLGIEDALLELPVNGAGNLHVTVPRPDSFLALSARGLFVYDWQDVHCRRPAVGAYELVCSPSEHLEVNGLPPALRSIAVRLEDSVCIGSHLLKVG